MSNTLAGPVTALPLGSAPVRRRFALGSGPVVQRCGGHACSCSAAEKSSGVRIGSPTDLREREADETAERVVRGFRLGSLERRDQSEPVLSRQVQEGASPTVARTDQLFPAEDLERDLEEERLAGTIQRQAAPGSSHNPQPGLAGRLGRAERSSGRSLDVGARSFMESRFGHSFADVRVHDDAAAADLCGEVSARAFTYGPHVYFSRGAYSPTGSGRRLLAHELTHVVQQRSAPRIVSRDCQYVAAHTAPDTYCQTEAEAQAQITRACPPYRDDFLYRDGPDDRPWRPIPGYGCAHHVAHRLGITTGQAWENCRGGFSVTIGQVTSGRTAHPLSAAQVNDIWSSGHHSGVVTEVDPTNAAGARVRVDQCGVGGNAAAYWFSYGNAYR